MSLKKRLDQIVRELGLSGRAFEKEVGLANGSYSSIRDGVGAEKLNKILTRYPQISADWLLRGSGEMMKKETDKDPPEGSGPVFAEERTSPRSSLNQDDMRTILFQMAGIVSGHQQEISRLITELEQNGRRSDRILDIIQQGLMRDDEPISGRDSALYPRPGKVAVD